MDNITYTNIIHSMMFVIFILACGRYVSLYLTNKLNKYNTKDILNSIIIVFGFELGYWITYIVKYII